MTRFYLLETTNPTLFTEILEKYVNDDWELFDVVIDPKIYMALLCKEDD